MPFWSKKCLCNISTFYERYTLLLEVAVRSTIFGRRRRTLKTPLQYIEQVSTVLVLMESAELILKLKKCFIFTDSIHYVEHTIRLGSPEFVTRMTDAMPGFKTTMNIKELRSFLGLCKVYQRLFTVSPSPPPR